MGYGQQVNNKGIAVCVAAVRKHTKRPMLDATYFVPKRRKMHPLLYRIWKIRKKLRQKLYQKG